MSFTALLKQTVTIYAAGSVNKYGRKTDGAGTEHKARVDLRTRTRHNAQGNLVTMAGQIFLKPDVSIDQGTRIDYDGHTYEVVHTYKVPGRNGVTHHIEADIVEGRG
jgi:hypothetical protein